MLPVTTLVNFQPRYLFTLCTVPFFFLQTSFFIYSNFLWKSVKHLKYGSNLHDGTSKASKFIRMFLILVFVRHCNMSLSIYHSSPVHSIRGFNLYTWVHVFLCGGLAFVLFASSSWNSIHGNKFLIFLMVDAAYFNLEVIQRWSRFCSQIFQARKMLVVFVLPVKLLSSESTAGSCYFAPMSFWR